jgi:hypothetical protein
MSITSCAIRTVRESSQNSEATGFAGPAGLLGTFPLEGLLVTYGEDGLATLPSGSRLHFQTTSEYLTRD